MMSYVAVMAIGICIGELIGLYYMKQMKKA